MRPQIHGCQAGHDNQGGNNNRQAHPTGTIDSIGKNGCDQFRWLAAMRTFDGFADSVSGEFEMTGALAALTPHKIVSGHLLALMRQNMRNLKFAFSVVSSIVKL